MDAGVAMPGLDVPEIRVKRAYRAARRSDGQRILVDRIWPRGLTETRLRLSGWAMDLAPSAELCFWFNLDRSRWDEFRRHYARELDARPQAVEAICRRLEEGPVTLVHAAKDERRNSAVALKEYLEERLMGRRS